MKRPRAALALVLALAACRSVLGIDDLVDDEGAAGVGGASGAGGKAGAAGRAGTGGGGAAGSGGGPAGDAKACQNDCLGQGGKKGLEEYYSKAKDCACVAGPAGCATPCDGECDLKRDRFVTTPVACVSCIAQVSPTPRCQDDLSGCTGECGAFRQCVERCGK